MLTGLMLVILMPVSLYAQTKTISGKVTDAKGVPMPGASVVIKHQQKELLQMQKENLKFLLLIMQPLLSAPQVLNRKHLSSDINGDLNVKLEEDIAKLDEVVVTGLATTVKRRNLANAVATISAKQLNGVAPAQTFDAALNGKIPGAYINANSGAPGGGISVKLRGVTSVFGNTQPLYVVDGVFMDNTATSAGLNAVTAAAAGR